jgi:hypothetical protein
MTICDVDKRSNDGARPNQNMMFWWCQGTCKPLIEMQWEGGLTAPENKYAYNIIILHKKSH